MSENQSKTPALDLEVAERELDILSERTKAAYAAYRIADQRQTGKIEEIRELKRQICEEKQS